MERKQQNMQAGRFAGNEQNPKQSAFSIPNDSTSGHVGPKSQNRKYRQQSGQARPSEHLRHDDVPPYRDGPASDSKKEGKRFEKSKSRAEKTGAKLDAARDKLAKQKPPKKPGPVKYAAKKAGAGAWYYVHQEIHEVENENVGVEASHRTEITGETAVRGTARFVKQRIRTRPARRASANGTPGPSGKSGSTVPNHGAGTPGAKG